MALLKELLNAIYESTELSTAEEIKAACELIIRVQDMDEAERDVIHATYRAGPLLDGEVPSKAGLGSLVEDGFVAKVIKQGKDGYNACTYKGAAAYRLMRVMDPRILCQDTDDK